MHETKIKTEESKKKFLSSFSKNQTDHRKHTTAKRAGHKKNKSLGCDMREKEY